MRRDKLLFIPVKEAENPSTTAPFVSYRARARTLFDETKAISMPEKKAEKSSAMMMMAIQFMISFVCLGGAA